MNKKSVSTVILQFLQEHQGEWYPTYHFCNRELYVGKDRYWLGNDAGRKARGLAIAGKIERKHDGKYAYFRAKPIPKLEAKQLSFGSTKAYNMVKT